MDRQSILNSFYEDVAKENNEVPKEFDVNVPVCKFATNIGNLSALDYPMLRKNLISIRNNEKFAIERHRVIVRGQSVGIKCEPSKIPIIYSIKTLNQCLDTNQCENGTNIKNQLSLQVDEKKAYSKNAKTIFRYWRDEHIPEKGYYVFVPRCFSNISPAIFNSTKLQKLSNEIKFNGTLRVTNAPQVAIVNRCLAYLKGILEYDRVDLKYMDGNGNEFDTYNDALWSSLPHEEQIKRFGHIRESQPPIQSKKLIGESTFASGILMMPCGTGKTECLIWMIIELGYSALVVVPTEQLMDQFIERIKKRAPHLRIGIIRGKKCVQIGSNYDVVIITYTSFASVEFDDSEIFAQFGTIIFDEAHHLPAPVNSCGMLKHVSLRAKYVIGATATPRRGDKISAQAFGWLLGPVMVCLPRATIKATYVQLKINQKTCVDYWLEPGKANMPLMKTMIGGHAHRNNVIAHFMVHSFYHLFEMKPREDYTNQSGIQSYFESTQTILFSDRCEQLCKGYGDPQAKSFPPNHIDLMTRIVNAIQYQAKRLGIELEMEQKKCQRVLWCTYNEKRVVFFSIGLYMGAISKQNRSISSECNILLATLAEAREGIDIDLLGTGFAATPFGDMEQAEGRLCRYNPYKKGVMFIDMCDSSCTAFNGMIRSHENYFLVQRGYTYVSINDCMDWFEKDQKLWNESWSDLFK